MTSPRRRPEPDLETNVSPAADALPADLRRDDPSPTPPDSLPPSPQAAAEEEPASGGFAPRPDGGNDQHPVHDEDDAADDPDEYEREIDRLDRTSRSDS